MHQADSEMVQEWYDNKLEFYGAFKVKTNHKIQAMRPNLDIVKRRKKKFYLQVMDFAVTINRRIKPKEIKNLEKYLVREFNNID